MLVTFVHNSGNFFINKVLSLLRELADKVRLAAPVSKNTLSQSHVLKAVAHTINCNHIFDD